VSRNATAPTSDPRRRALLDAALGVFMRFGYRKTSMDEVARAAQVSRQGLYLHFPSKEALFRATVEHTLESGLAAASARLRDESVPLEARLTGAFDEWIGRFVGLMGGDAADLTEAAGHLIGPLGHEHDRLFLDAVARTITASGLAAGYKAAGVSARQLADTLDAAARGLKHSTASREAFGRAMALVVRVVCANRSRQ
jgi:AcrR family transcriptional regulator